MNWDVLEGNWKQAKGRVKQKWGRLTDDQLQMISGKRDELLGQIQECYGVTRDEAERQIQDWEARSDKWIEKIVHGSRKSAGASQH